MGHSDQSKAGIWFPNWAEVLRSERLPAIHRTQYQQAIIGFLRFCKQTRQRATIEAARGFMHEVEAQRRLAVSQLAIWKEALNWFFTEAKKQKPPHLASPARGEEIIETGRLARRSSPTGTTMTDVPTLAAADLGKTDWERRLAQVLRSRHYLWRTEQTYRAWAGRFAEWLQGRGQRVEEAAI